MRNILCSLLLLVQVSAFAQIDEDDIGFIQSAYGKNKRAIVQELVIIDEKQHDAFWALYDRYEVKRKEILRERFHIIKEYATHYDSLDNKEAFRLINALLANTTKTSQLNVMYVKKFEKIVGGLNAALLFQLEEYLKTAFQVQLQANIPLVNTLHVPAQKP